MWSMPLKNNKHAFQRISSTRQSFEGKLFSKMNACGNANVFTSFTVSYLISFGLKPVTKDCVNEAFIKAILKDGWLYHLLVIYTI